MARKSTVKQLPEAIQAEIGRLVRANFTIDAILAHLKAMHGFDGEAPVSRSALGRHVKNLEKYEELLGQSRGVAEALVDKLGDAPDSKAARFNIEMMHALMMKLIITEDGKTAALDPENMMFLGRMLKDLASAKKTDVEAIKLIEQRAEARAKADAVKAAETVGREHGLSANTVDAIRAQILGVALPVKPAAAKQG